MLSVYSGSDRGPAEVDEADFHKYSFRCGRMLESDSRVIFYFKQSTSAIKNFSSVHVDM